MYVFMYVIYIFLRGNLAKLKSVISCDPMEMMRDFFFLIKVWNLGSPMFPDLIKRNSKAYLYMYTWPSLPCNGGFLLLLWLLCYSLIYPICYCHLLAELDIAPPLRQASANVSKGAVSRLFVCFYRKKEENCSHKYTIINMLVCNYFFQKVINSHKLWNEPLKIYWSG